MHAILRSSLPRTMCEFPSNGLQYKFLTLQPSVRFGGSPHLLHEKRPNAYLQWQKFHARVAVFTDKVSISSLPGEELRNRPDRTLAGLMVRYSSA